jgi:hypothetical protein
MLSPYIIFFKSGGGAVYKTDPQGDDKQLILTRPLAVTEFDTIHNIGKPNQSPPIQETPGIMYRSKHDEGYIPLTEIKVIISYNGKGVEGPLDAETIKPDDLISTDSEAESGTA